jgi:ABC-type dipeptide/oligopeptide/nickel transport system ATPase component
MSTLRGPTNLSKWVKPSTGRRVELYKAVKYINENEIVTIVGQQGIGKTHLAHEISYFLNSRYFFMKGNYYFDCRNIQTAEHCKKLLKEAN